MANPIVFLMLIFVILAFFYGGSKLFNKALGVLGKLAADLIGGILHFAADLLSNVLRAIGRPLERGARQVFRLPPPAPPPRRRPPPRRDDEDNEDH